MPRRAERSRRRIAARALGAALVALVALPLYLTLDRSWRPAAMRLSAALAVGAGCARARRWVREAMEPGALSALDLPAPEPPIPELDGRFVRLRDDLIGSTRSRRYFDVILWPRLRSLADAPLTAPALRRRLPRLGPPLRSIEALITQIERRS